MDCDMVEELWVRSLVFSVQGCTAADQILPGNTGLYYWNLDRSIWGVQMAVIPHLSATQAFKKISPAQERERQMGFFCPNTCFGMRLFKEMQQPSKAELYLSSESQELFNSWQHRNLLQKAGSAQLLRCYIYFHCFQWSSQFLISLLYIWASNITSWFCDTVRDISGEEWKTSFKVQRSQPWSREIV